MKGLFVYGTLLDRNIQKKIGGKFFSGDKAILPAHRKFQVRGASYPAAIAAKKGKVEGLVIFPDRTSLQRIRSYEGSLYCLQNVFVVGDRGKMFVRTFVWRGRGVRLQKTRQEKS